MLPSQKSVVRAGFRPEFYKENLKFGPAAGRRTAGANAVRVFVHRRPHHHGGPPGDYAMIGKVRFTMLVSSSAWYSELLACPDCTQDVALSDGILRCLSCSYSAPLGDLRSRDPQPFVTTMRRDLRFDPIKTLAALETSCSRLHLPGAPRHQGFQFADVGNHAVV